MLAAEESIHILENRVTLRTIYPLESLAAIYRQDPGSAVHRPPLEIGPVVRTGDLQSVRHKSRELLVFAEAGEGVMVGCRQVYYDD